MLIFFCLDPTMWMTHTNCLRIECCRLPMDRFKWIGQCTHKHNTYVRRFQIKIKIPEKKGYHYPIESKYFIFFRDSFVFPNIDDNNREKEKNPKVQYRRKKKQSRIGLFHFEPKQQQQQKQLNLLKWNYLPFFLSKWVNIRVFETLTEF